MAKPENAKQITMYVPADTLEQVDEAAYRIRQRRNDRTTWVLNAIDEKLERDAALTEGAETADAARLREIADGYGMMNEAGREWLRQAAAMARNAEAFKA